MSKPRRFASRILSASLAASALALAPEANAASVTIKHAQGETAVPINPQKIAVFDLSTLDNLDHLGIKVTGVPHESVNLPRNLKKYEGDDFIKIGSLHEPDYEVINAVAPDLIIVGALTASKYDALAKIAPTIDLTAWGHNLIAQVEANVKTLGRIFSRQAQARAEIERLDAAIAALKAKTRGKGKGLVIMTSGAKISGYGPGSVFGFVHEDFGVTPASLDINPAAHGQPIGSEFILETNPDWLFVIDRDTAIGPSIDREGDSARQVLDNDLIRLTTAWKEGQVIYLNSTDWCLAWAGLTSLHRAINQISQAFDRAE
ncbi:MAG: siderophore ABC transporter substrate-binding protein [Hyphomicrobiales bacterium]